MSGHCTKGAEGRNQFSPVFSRRVFDAGVFDTRIINALGAKEAVAESEGAAWARGERSRQWREFHRVYEARRKKRLYKHVVGEVGEYFETADGVVGWTAKHRAGRVR